MNWLSIEEVMHSYRETSRYKTRLPIGKMFLLAFLSGMIIALGAVAATTASFAIDNVSISRIIQAAIFPGGLLLVLSMGVELFTGNMLISIGVCEKLVTISAMLKNWAIVFFGNFAGGLFVAFFVILFGQANIGSAQLAVGYIKIAVAKTSYSFENAFVLGIFCNIIVCLAVLAAAKAKDTPGKFVGFYLPIFFFVISGFEHCVANMFYLSAGLFAKSSPQFYNLATEAGINMDGLSLGSFFSNNMIPVTLGNIAGGLLIAIIMWSAYRKEIKHIEIKAADNSK